MLTRRHFLYASLVAIVLPLGCTKDEPPPVTATKSTADYDWDDEQEETVEAGPKIDVDLPLLDALWKLDPIIRGRFPAKGKYDEDGIAALGIYFAKSDVMEHGGYASTPRNSLSFAWSGGDGEHCSLMAQENKIDANSPVVFTAPSNLGEENHVLANNFRDFLRLGLRHGFYRIRYFAYNPERALTAYGPINPEEEYSPASMGFSVEERELKIIAFVAESLELEPLGYTPEEYAELQKQTDKLLWGVE